MKTNIYITAILGFVFRVSMIGQNPIQVTTSTAEPFNISFWNAYADKLQLNASEKNEFITAHKKSHQQILAPLTPTLIQQKFRPPNPALARDESGWL